MALKSELYPGTIAVVVSRTGDGEWRVSRDTSGFVSRTHIVRKCDKAKDSCPGYNARLACLSTIFAVRMHWDMTVGFIFIVDLDLGNAIRMLKFKILTELITYLTILIQTLNVQATTIPTLT